MVDCRKTPNVKSENLDFQHFTNLILATFLIENNYASLIKTFKSLKVWNILPVFRFP